MRYAATECLCTGRGRASTSVVRADLVGNSGVPQEERHVAVRDDQFVELLALGHEQQGVEFKGPGPRTDKYLQGKVLRAILGMANRRDGGHIIIGVE